MKYEGGGYVSKPSPQISNFTLSQNFKSKNQFDAHFFQTKIYFLCARRIFMRILNLRRFILRKSQFETPSHFDTLMQKTCQVLKQNVSKRYSLKLRSRLARIVLSLSQSDTTVTL